MKRVDPLEAKAIDEVVLSLRERPMSRTRLASARAIIDKGNGEALFKALFDSLRSEHPESEEIPAITSLMPLLESMYDLEPVVAGYLMARLRPVASRRFFHNVADAIDLYMVSSTSEELAETLLRLAEEGVRPRLQKLYASWAAAIRGEVARTSR
jgi:hypothetical protein